MGWPPPQTTTRPAAALLRQPRLPQDGAPGSKPGLLANIAHSLHPP